MLAKKALIARLRGDEKLAEDWAENYLKTYQSAKERMGDGDVDLEGWIEFAPAPNV
jgi:anaphase-promoting complex subunit 5